MMQMILVLLVFVVVVYWWMNRKPAVAYKPSREDILIILRKVFGGMNTELEWETFVGVPIDHDPMLEDVRKKCVAIEDNPANHTETKEDFIFNEPGLMEIKKLISELEGLCKAKGREKTVFQINCAQILEHKMEQLGLKFSTWGFIDGQEESYFLGELKGTQVYIYEDGASVKSSHGSYMYEKQDYKGENELIRAVIGKFTELTMSPDPR